MVKKLLTIIGLLVLVASMATASVKRLSLKDVKEMAVKHNATVLNAKLDVRIAKKKIWETTAIGLPQINGLLEYQNFPSIPTTLIPAEFFDPDASAGEFAEVKFGTKHNANFSVTVNQLIFKGSYIVGLQASRIYLQLSKDRLKKSEKDIMEAVTNTYYLILLAEESEKILLKSIKNIKQTLYETTEMFKSGFLESTDVDQIKLSISDLKNNLSSIRRQKEVTYRLLKFQIGMDLDAEIIVSEKLKLLLDGLNRGKLLSGKFDVQNYIDYMMLDTVEKSQKLLLRNEKSMFLPSITAYFRQSYSAMRDDFNFFRKNDDKWFSSTVIGLNLEIPIFDSGTKLARIAQARMELKKARNDKLNAQKGLRVEYEKAKAALVDEMNKLNNTEEAVKLAKRVFENNQLKYKKGTVSSLDLIQTHNQYLNSKSNYIQNIVALFNAKTQIDKYLNRL